MLTHLSKCKERPKPLELLSEIEIFNLGHYKLCKFLIYTLSSFKIWTQFDCGVCGTSFPILTRRLSYPEFGSKVINEFKNPFFVALITVIRTESEYKSTLAVDICFKLWRTYTSTASYIQRYTKSCWGVDKKTSLRWDYRPSYLYYTFFSAVWKQFTHFNTFEMNQINIKYEYENLLISLF